MKQRFDSSAPPAAPSPSFEVQHFQASLGLFIYLQKDQKVKQFQLSEASSKAWIMHKILLFSS